jgi:hypothetical protein
VLILVALAAQPGDGAAAERPLQLVLREVHRR